MRGLVDLGDGFAAAVGDPDLLDEARVAPYIAELREPLGGRGHVEYDPRTGYFRAWAFIVNAAPAKGPRHHA